MENDIDGTIDQALTGYANATPLAGLEQRVLNRIGMAEAQRRRVRFWNIALALGTAALLVVLTIGHRPVKVLPKAVVPPVTIAVSREVDATVPVRHRTRSPKRRPVPDVAPLTGEERALLALAQHQPAEVLQFSEWADIEPIQIQPLTIEEQK